MNRRVRRGSQTHRPPSQPLPRSSSVSLGLRWPSAVEPVATARRADKRTNPRTDGGIPRCIRQLNRTRQKGQSVGRLAPSCRRSISWRQSPSARHEPDVAGDSLTSDRQGGAAGHRGWFRGSARWSLWPIRISRSKHQRPRTLDPHLPPRRACGFRPGGGRRQTPTMARPGRVMRRASQRQGEAPRDTPPDLITRRSAPAATRPRSSAFAPPASCPAWPNRTRGGKTRAQGFANLSGN